MTDTTGHTRNKNDRVMVFEPAYETANGEKIFIDDIKDDCRVKAVFINAMIAVKDCGNYE
tara:strand:- start:628 stop:807 length:180 start_codon:yes stop_codon:yes gene_type:complete